MVQKKWIQNKRNFFLLFLGSTWVWTFQICVHCLATSAITPHNLRRICKLYPQFFSVKAMLAVKINGIINYGLIIAISVRVSHSLFLLPLSYLKSLCHTNIHSTLSLYLRKNISFCLCSNTRDFIVIMSAHFYTVSTPVKP